MNFGTPSAAATAAAASLSPSSALVILESCKSKLLLSSTSFPSVPTSSLSTSSAVLAVGAVGVQFGQNVDNDNDESSSSSSDSVNRRMPSSEVVSMSKTVLPSRQTRGRLALVMVSFLYGTLNVSLRLLYAMPNNHDSGDNEKWTLTPPLVSFIRGWLTVLCFAPLFFSQLTTTTTTIVTGTSSTTCSTEKKDRKSTRTVGDDDGDDGHGESLKSKASPSPPSILSTPCTIRKLLPSAVELGFWNVAAQGLLNIGLQRVSSIRASLLTQTSVVWTPFLSLLLSRGRNVVSTGVWAGCGMALVGFIILSAGDNSTHDLAGGADGGDGGGATPTAAGSASSSPLLSAVTNTVRGGDALVLSSALCWSVYLHRLSTIAARRFRTRDIPLVQAWSALMRAALYSIWYWTSGSSSSYSSLLRTLPTQAPIQIWILLLYSSIGPGAIASVLQQHGQKDISASEANVILSLEPVFTAVCARWVLGEVTTTRENLGGIVLIFAALMASGVLEGLFGRVGGGGGDTNKNRHTRKMGKEE